MQLEQAVGQQFLLSFAGKREPPPPLQALLQRQQIAGIVLFRAKNVGTLEELRELTAALQRTAASTGQPPLLIAADQEGGQLMAIGEGTPFPGNMALGATRSEKLARRVGQAIGRELAAAGVNVDFAPVCDVSNNPKNPVVGTRSFGEDPKLVGRLAAAMVKGLQSAGVAATAKHFPGHGDTATDSHHAATVLPHDLKRVRRVELPPFQAAIDAGARLVMSAHIVFPALNGGGDLPATLSPAILRGLLRRKLGFKGLIVTDAMDMNAMEQGPGYVADAMAAIAAGADLLLLNHDLDKVERAFATILQAARRGLLGTDEIEASAARVLALKKWVGGREQPPLDVVACPEHRALAREIAEESVTLVRDRPKLLPLRLAANARVAVVAPKPEDLTPADTSSYLTPQLAAAVRRHHPCADEFLIPLSPDSAEIGALCDALAGYDLVIAGTINATDQTGQAALLNALLKRQALVIAIALRTPFDLHTYPDAPVYACTYSILGPSMDSVADALWGKIRFRGEMPVTL
jgi:beta-N-acetylhexosaminidase